MYKFILLLFTVVCGVSISDAQTQQRLPVWTRSYDLILPSDDVFIVAKDKKMGVVSEQGNLVARLVYDTIFNFQEGIAIVGQGEHKVNQFGKVFSTMKYGYLNKTGRLVLPMQYEHIENFSEGLGLIFTGHRYNYYDKQGKLALVMQHVYASQDFKGNTAFVEVQHNGFWLAPYNDGRYNGKHTQLYDINGNTIYGNYIDRSGRLLIPWKYDTIAPYQSGYLRPVRKNGKWGFLDSLAQVAVPLEFDDIDADSLFFWQQLRRVGQGNRYGFMNSKTGQLIVPLAYEATLPSQRPVIWVRQKSCWGVIDSQQHTILAPRYDDATPFDRQGLSVVKKDGAYGVVDTQGHELTEIQYEHILPFQENRAVVKRAGKFGFIAIDGQEVIPAVYDQVSEFVNGRAFAKRWGLFLTLTKKGDWVDWKFQSQTLQWIVALFVVLAGGAWLYWQHYKQGAKPVSI